MTEYVRVRNDITRHEFTIPARQVVDGLTVLDKPALGRDRLPRPPKYYRGKGDGPAPSTQLTARPHERNGEKPVPTATPQPESTNGHEAETTKEK